MADATPARPDAPRRAAATRRDVVEAGTRATRRDHPDEVAGAGPAVDTGGLPPPVFEEYEPVELMGGGGEAQLVMRVRHRANGTDHVIKLYSSVIRPDPELLEVLRRDDSGHLVRITDWGEHTDAYGRSVSWEVLEHISGGSLRELMTREGPALSADLVREVLVELTKALEHLHSGVGYGSSGGLAHRDVKPENVLLRARSPLELAFCDFGLVAEIRATRMTARRAGTAEYQAPETWQRRSREASQDWWSLGIVVTELLTGRNPNSGIMNEAIDDEFALFEHLTQHGVDLSDVTDDRWRMLCAGLLTFAQDYRWGAEQVRAWLDDKSPAVHSGRFEQRPVRPSAPPIDIAGRPCREPGEVALAMSENWAAAARLFEDRDERLDLTAWLEDNFADVRLPKDLLRRDPRSRAEAFMRVARFISWTAPELRPTFQGRAVDADGVAALATAAAIGDPAAATMLDQLDAAALRVFGKHRCSAHPRCAERDDGCEVLDDMASRLDNATRTLDQQALALAPLLRQAPSEPLSRQEISVAKATLIRSLVDTRFATTLRNQLSKDRDAARVDWWQGLLSSARGGQSPAHLVALVLAGATTGRARAAAAVRANREAVLRDQARRLKVEKARATAARFTTIWWNLLAWAVGLVLTYLTTFLAIQGLRLVPDGPLAATTDFIGFTTETQVRLVFPVALLLACASLLPNRPPSARAHTARIAWGTGVVLAIATVARQTDALVFPIEWRLGVADRLLALNTLVLSEPESLPVTLVIAVVAGLALTVFSTTLAKRGQVQDLRGVVLAKGLLVTSLVAIFALRLAILWFDLRAPTWLPNPMTVWLSV